MQRSHCWKHLIIQTQHQKDAIHGFLSVSSSHEPLSLSLILIHLLCFIRLGTCFLHSCWPFRPEIMYVFVCVCVCVCMYMCVRARANADSLRTFWRMDSAFLRRECVGWCVFVSRSSLERVCVSIVMYVQWMWDEVGWNIKLGAGVSLLLSKSTKSTPGLTYRSGNRCNLEGFGI